MAEKEVRFWKRHRLMGYTLVLIGLITLIIVGFQVYIYVKFLLGYDLTIRLGAEDNDFNLVNGETEVIQFKIDKIASVVCTTRCEYKFTDLSTNEFISSGSFLPLPAISSEISQEITAPEKGEGQKVYAFDLTCKNQKTRICKTDSKNVTRRTIITLEYSLSEKQQLAKKQAQDVLNSNYSRFSSINKTINSINSQISLQNISFIANDVDSKMVIFTLNEFIQALNKSLGLLAVQDYDSIINDDSLESYLYNLNNNFDIFTKGISLNTNAYNSLIDNITDVKSHLENIKNLDLEEAKANEADVLIDSFNKKIVEFNSKTNMADKTNITLSINSINLSGFSASVNGTYRANETILASLTKIGLVLNLVNANANITLPETKRICCLDNQCQYCQTQVKYPIILIHGHNFNQDISADNSINSLGKLQESLESLGYLDAGELYLYEPTRQDAGVLSTIKKPIVVRTSYYFDFLTKPEGYQSIQIKSDNIDTYSIKLKEIIENVKYETSSDKVIIIAHSMGGLVARRYVQVFGNSSIDRIILIDTPNKGITGKISQVCSVFGASLECRDMDSESLFINKLNTAKSSSVKIKNVVGTGCLMDSKDGDGIVLSENSIILDEGDIQTFLVRGNCTATDFLHNEILDTEKYPELIEIIKEALK